MGYHSFLHHFCSFQANQSWMPGPILTNHRTKISSSWSSETAAPGLGSRQQRFHMAATCWPIFPPLKDSPLSARGSVPFPLNLPNTVWKMWRQAERTEQTRAENLKRVSLRLGSGGSSAGQRSKRRQLTVLTCCRTAELIITQWRSWSMSDTWLVDGCIQLQFMAPSARLFPSDIASSFTHIPWKYTWSPMCSSDSPAPVTSRRFKTFGHIVE